MRLTLNVKSPNMYYQKTFITLLAYEALLFTNVLGDVVFNPPIDQDVCHQLCRNNALKLDHVTKSQCERGCRLFNIGMNTNWSAEKTLDLNATKDQCFQSCADAYSETARPNCFTGCSEMFQLQKEAWLFYLEQQGDSSVLEVEVSLVSDPALWEQTVDNSVYKMPQTFMRTMPLRPELSDVIDGKNWAPCTPQSNDIPRWFVALMAMALTVFTLYVYVVLPPHSDGSLIEDGGMDICRHHLLDDDFPCDGNDLRKELNILYHSESIPKKDIADDILDISHLNLITLNEFLTEDYHINVVPPPKYTVLPV